MRRLYVQVQWTAIRSGDRHQLRRSLAGYSQPTMDDLKPEQVIALVAPIVVIQLGLMIAALIDLERDERRVRGGSKLVWALVIVFINVVGPILYFVAGREEA
jgi:hypothetical protein